MLETQNVVRTGCIGLVPDKMTKNTENLHSSKKNNFFGRTTDDGQLIICRRNQQLYRTDNKCLSWGNKYFKG